MFKKKTDFAGNLYSPGVECEKGVFQIQSPIFGIKFSNNMSLPQDRVNIEWNLTWHNIWNLLTINILDKSYSTLLGEKFRIYKVQITRKSICETPLSLHNAIISSPM